MIPERHPQAYERVIAGHGEPDDGFLAALTAAKLGRLDQMIEILKSDTSVDYYFLAESVTEWAHAKESIACAEWLLDRVVDVNRTQVHQPDWNIAHSCALHGTVDMMRLLVARGVNMRAKDLKCDEEVIHKSQLNESPAMLGYLLELGIDPDLTDLRGYTLLDHALSLGRADQVEILRARGASKGRHRVIPKPIRLKPHRYRRCMKWEAREFGSRVGPAPAEFVEWMQRHELPRELVQLFSEIMPLQKISIAPPDHDISGDLCDAESIIKTCDWLPQLVVNGLLPIAETDDSGMLILDFIGGGRVGLFCLESVRSLNPRVDINFNFARTLGDAIRKCLNAPRW